MIKIKMAKKKQWLIAGLIILILIFSSRAFYFYIINQPQPPPLPNSTLNQDRSANFSSPPSSTHAAILNPVYQINNQILTLSLKINSDAPMQFDGADLVLSYPETMLTALKIETGKAIDICPKRVIDPTGKIEVSCINKLENPQSGIPNQDVIQITFKIKNLNKPVIKIDNLHTKIYFLGKSLPLKITTQDLIIK
jgi:hypothetical protein